MNRATVAGGDVVITDEAGQAELAENAPDDVNTDPDAVNTDLDRAQEITKDETNSATVYIDTEAIQEIASGFETIRDAYDNIKDIAIEEGWFTPDLSNFMTGADVEGMNDEDLLNFANAVANADCSTNTSWLNFNWLLATPAYAQSGGCVVPGYGTLSPADLAGCAEILEDVLRARGFTGVANWVASRVNVVVLLIIPTPMGGDPVVETHVLPDGSAVTISWDGDTLDATVEIDGEIYSCAVGGDCVDSSGNVSDYHVDLNENGTMSVVEADGGGDEDHPSGGVDEGGVSPDPGCEPDDDACWEDLDNSDEFDQNRLNHIFRPDHELEPLVNTYGSQQRALQAVQNAANQALRNGQLNVLNNGTLPSANQGGSIIQVGPHTVRLIGGRVVDGRVQISSISMRGL